MYLRPVAAILVAVQLGACTTMTPVLDTGEGRTAQIKVGDTVLATGKDGRKHGFEVARTSPDEICSGDKCILRADVVSLEVKEFSAWRTVAVVAGTALLVAAVIAAGQGAAAAAALGAMK